MLLNGRACASHVKDLGLNPQSHGHIHNSGKQASEWKKKLEHPKIIEKYKIRRKRVDNNWEMSSIE